VLSRDVRAPNLSELFAAPVSTTVPSFTNPFNNSSLTIIQNVVGNTALTPEKARNLEVGLVLSDPDFLPGFNASIDYYRIKIRDVISNLTARQEVDFCFAGLQQYCGAFNLAPPSGTPFVNVQAFNLASIYTNGFDIETSYRMGGFTVRALATHVINFITDSGIPGTLPVQQAGVNIGTTSNTPRWKLYATQSWDAPSYGVALTERWISHGVFGHQYIVCQTNCPVSTVNNPTIDRNEMAGALYFDLGGYYSVSEKLVAFAKIDNLLDRDPVASPQTNTGLDINPAVYDTIGRIYRAGLRYNF
jgi:iron complex outermembrane recepter protein